MKPAKQVTVQSVHSSKFLLLPENEDGSRVTKSNFRNEYFMLAKSPTEFHSGLSNTDTFVARNDHFQLDPSTHCDLFFVFFGFCFISLFSF